MKQHKYIAARLGGSLSLIASGLLAISANADPLAVGTVIGVDFGQTAPNNGAGNIFNGATSGLSGSIAAGSLVDMDNAVVDGVSFEWSGGQYNGNTAADSTDLPGQPAIYNDSNLTDYLLNKNGVTKTLAFSGLDDSLTYNLNIGGGFIYSANDADTLYAADGQSFTNKHDDGVLAWGNLNGLTTDGSSRLVIMVNDAAGKTDKFAIVSALTLTAVSVSGSGPDPDPFHLSVAGYDATNGTLNFAATGIPEGQVFHFEQSGDLVDVDFAMPMPAFAFDSTTVQPFEISVDSSTNSPLFFRAFAGGSLEAQPNIIFMLTDDLGYSDVGCYGATKVLTPNIDQLAAEGFKFTDCHAAASICSPSRAAFLTGAYPQRAGLYLGINPLREQHWFLGLNPDETTIAEQLRRVGYKTFMVGKWHLGTEPEFLPRIQGFDHYYGMPSNYNHSPRFFDDDNEIYAQTPLELLTELYTERVTSIIRQNGNEPFFLYYAHNYPHTPYAAGTNFVGTSQDGVRGDVMQELDWSVGEIMQALEDAGIARNTIFVFTSDNGPTNGKYAKPFRGTKYVTLEGGHRVPFIIHWPERIVQGAVSETSIHAMDLFPTLSEAAGAPMPEDRVYDGESLLPLLDGRALQRASDEAFYYYNCENLQAVRTGDWKLHLSRTAAQTPFWDGRTEFLDMAQPVLYNLRDDPGEGSDVAQANPEVVQEMLGLAGSIRLELGEYMQRGSAQRPTGSVYPSAPVISHPKDWWMVPDEIVQALKDERERRHP